MQKDNAVAPLVFRTGTAYLVGDVHKFLALGGGNLDLDHTNLLDDPPWAGRMVDGAHPGVFPKSLIREQAEAGQPPRAGSRLGTTKSLL